MGAKDVFKSGKWYKPLGTSYHGGGAYEAHQTPKQAKERENQRKVDNWKHEIKACKKCKKLGGGMKGVTCAKHAKTATLITKYSK